VRGEKIVGLLEAGLPLPARRRVDATGRFVVPGGIDTHTHVSWRWADQKSQDDFGTAGIAALAAGATTLLHFVPMARGADPPAAGDGRMAAARATATVDYSFHPILTSAAEPVLRAVPRLVDMGLCSFKIYTTYDDVGVTDAEAWLLMQRISESGGLP